MKVEIGDKIKIVNMDGEPQYNGRVGIVNHIDSKGQVFGTWGGLAVQLENDEIEIIEKVKR